MSRHYGEPRRQAQVELRAAATQLLVDAELLVHWLDELGGDAASEAALEQRHVEVLRGAHAFEATLNHLVMLERVAAQRPPNGDAAAAAPATGEAEPAEAESMPKARRRTVDIVGDPDKPSRGRGPREHVPDPARGVQAARPPVAD